jgi:hypothetical protein
MSTKKITTLALAGLCLTLVGCGESTKSEIRPAAKASAPQPVLTSTAAPPIERRTQAIAPISSVPSPEPSVGEKTDETESASGRRRFEAETESVDGLSIQRFVTAERIEKREPVEPTAVFDHHVERVYAFFDIRNESSSPRTLIVHFIGPDEEVRGGVELEIPSSVPRWRTWAFTRWAKEPGLWRVEVRDGDGRLVGALPFEVEPGC